MVGSPPVEVTTCAAPPLISVVPFCNAPHEAALTVGPEGADFGHVTARTRIPVAGFVWCKTTESKNAMPFWLLKTASPSLSCAHPWPTSSKISSSGVLDPDAFTRFT